MSDDEGKKPVPDEIAALMYEAVAARELRDKFANGFFKFRFRRAVYFGGIAEKKRAKFWGAVRELYPEFKKADLNFDMQEQVVYLQGEEKE